MNQTRSKAKVGAVREIEYPVERRIPGFRANCPEWKKKGRMEVCRAIAHAEEPSRAEFGFGQRSTRAETMASAPITGSLVLAW